MCVTIAKSLTMCSGRSLIRIKARKITAYYVGMILHSITPINPICCNYLVQYFIIKWVEAKCEQFTHHIAIHFMDLTQLLQNMIQLRRLTEDQQKIFANKVDLINSCVLLPTNPFNLRLIRQFMRKTVNYWAWVFWSTGLGIHAMLLI